MFHFYLFPWLKLLSMWGDMNFFFFKFQSWFWLNACKFCFRFVVKDTLVDCTNVRRFVMPSESAVLVRGHNPDRVRVENLYKYFPVKKTYRHAVELVIRFLTADSTVALKDVIILLADRWVNLICALIFIIGVNMTCIFFNFIKYYHSIQKLFYTIYFPLLWVIVL